jgi:hypothetical protein
MAWQVVESPEEWALEQFGDCELGDVRRKRRAVILASQMASKPSGSIPEQTGKWSGAKAGYRLFDQEGVTFEGVESPHWEKTRERARACPVVLMIEDTSELDFTRHGQVKGIGPIGNGRGRGFILHSTLAVDPEGSGEVLGLAYQMLFCRLEEGKAGGKVKGESRTARKRRKRESEIWPRSVEAVGCGEASSRWVHVCDRYADNYEMFSACQRTRVNCVIRIAQDRRAALGHEEDVATGCLLAFARDLPEAGETTLYVRGRSNRVERWARLRVSYSPMTMFKPWLDRSGPSRLEGWVVRVWEADTPAGEDPIEWVLWTTIPVRSVTEALEISRWYSLRWLIEEYHKCLKSGCKVEKRQLEDASRLGPCIGILAVVGVRLLQLKLAVKREPDRPAKECVSPLHVRVLGMYRQQDMTGLTVGAFFREVAKLGGFLARKGDGDPGWQTLWRGWQRLDAMTLGASLALSEAQKCG